MVAIKRRTKPEDISDKVKKMDRELKIRCVLLTTTSFSLRVLVRFKRRLIFGIFQAPFSNRPPFAHSSSKTILERH